MSFLLIVGTTKFLTTFLSEKGYGQLALYNSILSLPSLFYFGPLGQGIMRYLPIARDNKEITVFDRQYIRLYQYGAAATLVTGIIAACVLWFLKRPEWSAACILIALIAIISGINNYRYGLQNIARKRILSLSLETGGRLLQQLLAIGFLLFITNDPLIALCGYAVASFIFYFINRFYYHKSFPETVPKKDADISSAKLKYTDHILRYCWPYFLFGFLTWFQTASDRWTLEILCSTEAVAQYSVLNQIGFQSLVLLFGSISYFLFPILLNRAGNSQSTGQFYAANHLNNWYLVLNIVFCVTIFFTFLLFGSNIIRFLSAEHYVENA